MQKTSLALRIPQIMWMLFSLTVIIVVGSMYFASQNANRIAAENSRTMILGGYNAEVSRLEDLVYDYSVWQIAHDKAGERDEEWLYENMGSSVTFGLFDFMELYWPEDQTSMGWEAATDPEVNSGILDKECIAYAHQALNAVPVAEAGIVNFLAVQLGGVYLITASRFEPDDPADVTDPENLPINFMGQRLNDDFIAQLGMRFLIDDLHLITGGSDTEIIVPLYGLDGVQLAGLAWTPPRPGAALVKSAIAPLTAALLLFLGLSQVVSRRAAESAARLLKNEQNSAKLARTDHLTNLPNRLAFNERLNEAIAADSEEIALMITDLNNFKKVNDTLGHAAGDELIISLTKRIEETLHGDVFFARLGGDEFSFLFIGKNAEESLCGFVNSLKSALEPAFYLRASPFYLTTAMGYAVREAGCGLPMDEFVRQADSAMYLSKSSSSDILVRFDAELDPDRMQELELETTLRKALEDPSQFYIDYQPIVGGSGDSLDFAEALLRWDSPVLGKVSPADFIPVAEASGQIGRVTSMVLGMVCADLGRAQEMVVSVNISPLQINDAKFHDDLADALKRHGVRPEQLVIELTEGVLVENPRGLSVSLQKLRLLGHRIALDDFGTGYSSIGYLRQMEFTMLKVDKSLIDGVTKSERAREILTATLRLAKAIDIQIVAEGVETEEQARALADMGFDMQQGFNFSGGVPFDELPRLEPKKKVA